MMYKSWVLNLILSILFLLITCSLSFAEQTFKIAPVINSAQDRLLDYLSRSIATENVEVSLTRSLQDVTLPNGKVSYVVNDQEISNIGKFYTIPVTLYLDGKPNRTLYTNFKVRSFENVVVTNRPLKMHEIITREDLSVSRQEIGNENDYYSDIEEVIGLRTATYVPSGKTITPANIEKVPLVVKNKQVKVVGRIGDIEASIFGIAQENGYKDDIIKVQNPSSQKTFLAKVVKKDYVELAF